MRIPILWMLSLIPAFAAKLELLAIEVPKPLVEKTMAVAIGKDHDALDNALDNLRKLAPEQGVVEHASVTLTMKETDQHASDEKFKNNPPVPERPGGLQHGRSLLWRSSDNLRMLSLRFVSTAVSSPMFEFEFRHQPDTRWSLSAATTTLNGALLVFEKTDDPVQTPESPAWILGTISDNSIEQDQLASSPVQWLANPPSRYAAVLRKPTGPKFLSCKARMDLRPYCKVSADYVSSAFRLETQSGVDPNAGKLAVSIHAILVKSNTATDQLREEGATELFLDPRAASSSANLETEVRSLKTVRNGNSLTEGMVKGPHPTRFFHASFLKLP